MMMRFRLATENLGSKEHFDGNDSWARSLALAAIREARTADERQTGEVNRALLVMAPAERGDGKSQIDPKRKAPLDAYTAILGLLMHQDGVEHHRSYQATTKAKWNAVARCAGQHSENDLTQQLWASIDSQMQAWRAADWEANDDSSAELVSRPEGTRVVNCSAVEDSGGIKRLITGAAAGLPFEVDSCEFASDGDLVSNNWQENSDGQGYRSRITAAGRQDLLGWGRDVLAPLVQAAFEDFSEKCGWGDSGKTAQGFATNEATQVIEQGGHEALHSRLNAKSQRVATDCQRNRVARRRELEDSQIGSPVSLSKQLARYGQALQFWPSDVRALVAYTVCAEFEK
jgi:hypothetical protein